MTSHLRTGILLLVVVALTAYAGAADPPAPKKKKAPKEPRKELPTYLTPESAPPDFQIQGEFLGDLAGKKLGCQVISDGDGNFRCVFLPGGLPGAGSDNKDRVEGKGKTNGDKTDLSAGTTYAATISADGQTIEGGTTNGQSFTLHKVHRKSPEEGAKPPPGAIVLFDGTNGDAWENPHIDEQRHLIMAGTKTKRKFQDFTLHLEFYLPYKPTAHEQERANSGIYIQDRYEVQVLDSFGLPGEFNECGALYRQVKPLVNMCFPPLTWQTYDIDFQAARFDESGKKTKPAVVTVRQNGVLVQDHTELKDKTGGGQKEGPQPGPIQLQGHNNPVFYRNIWIIDKSNPT